MGLLARTDNGRRYTLGSRCLLGRHPVCDIQVDNSRVSGEHASLHWMGNRWELRDLGSLNGTFLDGKRLSSGERVTLESGQSFVLGSGSASFQLVESGPPAARARNLATGDMRVASGTLLLLPEDENPLASLFLDANGRWVLDKGDAQHIMTDQGRLWLDGMEWSVELPTALTETMEEARGAALADVHLRIGISRNEEHVEITLMRGGELRSLPSRSYHYLLATLARTWLAEREQPETERGWVERDKLCRMLATDANRLNVDIHRVRRQFGALGIHDAAGIVERRPDTSQVRLGVRSVEVFTL